MREGLLDSGKGLVSGLSCRKSAGMLGWRFLICGDGVPRTSCVGVECCETRVLVSFWPAKCDRLAQLAKDCDTPL